MLATLLSNLKYRLIEWRTRPTYQYVAKGDRRG